MIGAIKKWFTDIRFEWAIAKRGVQLADDVAENYESNPRAARDWLIKDGFVDPAHIDRYVAGEITKRQFLKGIPCVTRLSSVAAVVARDPRPLQMMTLAKIAD